MCLKQPVRCKASSSDQAALHCVLIYRMLHLCFHIEQKCHLPFLSHKHTHTRARTHVIYTEFLKHSGSCLVCFVHCRYPQQTVAHAQPFKLQLLLSAARNQKQTQSPRPSLPPHTSLGDVLWFPVQSIMALPYLLLGPHDTLQLRA